MGEHLGGQEGAGVAVSIVVDCGGGGGCDGGGDSVRCGQVWCVCGGVEGQHHAGALFLPHQHLGEAGCG